MELAKVTSKGQITIPKSIREMLNIKEGSKILFFKQGNEVVIKNAAMLSLEKIQEAFKGEASRLNLENEEDVVNLIKEFRKERKNDILVYSPIDVEEKIFEIRDEDDYIILYTAILEDVDIFITGDKDFDDVKIDKPEIMKVNEFLEKY